MAAFKKLFFVLVFLLILLLAGFFLLARYNNLVESPTKNATSSALPSSELPEKEATEVTSPDGSITLILEKESRQRATVYSLYINNSSEEQEKIFEKEKNIKDNIELSQNSWSPDNKYFFIKEKTSDKLSYLVFKATGEPFFDNEIFDAAEIFREKDTGFLLHDITGWDSPRLLHVLTKNENGASGASFWIDVVDRSVIRLASR